MLSLILYQICICCYVRFLSFRSSFFNEKRVIAKQNNTNKFMCQKAQLHSDGRTHSNLNSFLYIECVDYRR